MSSDCKINMKLLMVAVILCLLFVGDGKFTLNCSKKIAASLPLLLQLTKVFHANKTCTMVSYLLSAF